jgi:hypothetical protein
MDCISQDKLITETLVLVHDFAQMQNCEKQVLCIKAWKLILSSTLSIYMAITSECIYDLVWPIRTNPLCTFSRAH